jgi:hypothetical protein
MRVTTTIFIMETHLQESEAGGSAFTQEYVPSADPGSEFEFRSFVSLYSGQNRIGGMDSSAH